MDYLLGLRLITALSFIGLAFLVGGKVYASDKSRPSVQSSVQPEESRPVPERAQEKAKKLREDFWEKLTHKN